MISLCQEGKSSPDALRRSAGVISFRSARVLASRPWFLLDLEPDFHLLSQPVKAAQKIEFVFSCQSRNYSNGSMGSLRSLAQSA